MFYYLYEIRNNLNGKIYVGVHKTKVMDDGYMGSGKVIRSAIEKYGIENFTKVILETFDDSKSMYAREKEVVTDEFLLREDVYNLRRGGFGGFEYINKNSLNRFCDPVVARKGRVAANKKMLEELGEGWLTKVSSLGANARNEYIKQRRQDDSVFDDMIRENARSAAQAAGAANKKLMWITNEIENMKINKESEIPKGWRRGRLRHTHQTKL